MPAFTLKVKNPALIRIPVNATTETVKDSLTKYFGKKYANEVIKITRFISPDFSSRHGAYQIEKGFTPLTSARKLSSGAQTPIHITINGFRNQDLMVRRISEKFDFTPDSMRRALNDTELLTEYGLTPENSMALFLDDTYELYWSASPKDVIRKIGSNYLNFWNSETEKKANRLGLTPAEVTTIASIADEESNKQDEKGTIGRLYINRLNKNMRLQSDPTVRFSLNDFSIKRIRSKHLSVESPYNTYKHLGLPPGPIRTTSKQTIESILSSEPNDYLYMCAKEDFSGYHNFAKDFATHSNNARKYQKALNGLGIK